MSHAEHFQNLHESSQSDPVQFSLKLVNLVFPHLRSHFYSIGWKESFGTSMEERETVYDWETKGRERKREEEMER